MEETWNRSEGGGGCSRVIKMDVFSSKKVLISRKFMGMNYQIQFLGKDQKQKVIHGLQLVRLWLFILEILMFLPHI